MDLRIYNIGDLIKLSGSLCLGLIVDKHRFPLIPEYMYKIHLCGEEEADRRWLFPDDMELLCRGI